jgi:hypothetical protein
MHQINMVALFRMLLKMHQLLVEKHLLLDLILFSMLYQMIGTKMVHRDVMALSKVQLSYKDSFQTS